MHAEGVAEVAHSRPTHASSTRITPARVRSRAKALRSNVHGAAHRARKQTHSGWRCAPAFFGVEIIAEHSWRSLLRGTLRGKIFLSPLRKIELRFRSKSCRLSGNISLTVAPVPYSVSRNMSETLSQSPHRVRWSDFHESPESVFELRSVYRYTAR